MLFTRCPDCDTTFRVTDDALKKAHGQVRCGRCASVFNAYAELQRSETEPPPAASPPQPSERSEDAAPPPPEEQQPAVAPPPESAEAPALDAAAAERALPSEPPAAAPPAVEPVIASPPTPQHVSRAPDPIGVLVADVVAQVERGGAGDGDAGEFEVGAWSEPATISAAQVDAVLEIKEPDPPVNAPDWTLPAEQRRRSRWWSMAAIVAVGALGAQLLHHFRADLVGQAFVGPILRDAYGMLGTTVTPRWNIRQYRILDWVASAEPNSRGQGNLRITARIQNVGPQPQPYPSVHLRLKDRWEAAVGSRVFAPAQYLDPTLPIGRLMTPGETARAQLDVVDPGPDAYGFELDVCIEVEADVLSCGTDKVFQ